MESDSSADGPDPSWIVVSAFSFDDLCGNGHDDDVICPGCPGSGDPGSFRERGEYAGRVWAQFTCGHVVVSAADAPTHVSAVDRSRRPPRPRSGGRV